MAMMISQNSANPELIVLGQLQEDPRARPQLVLSMYIYISLVNSARVSSLIFFYNYFYLFILFLILGPHLVVRVTRILMFDFG